MEQSILLTKSKDLSVSVYKKVIELQKKQKDFILSQWWAENAVRIGSSMHAIQTKRNLLTNLFVARKSSSNAMFYTDLLNEMGYLSSEEYDKFAGELLELLKMIQASISTIYKKRKESKNESVDEVS